MVLIDWIKYRDIEGSHALGTCKITDLFYDFSDGTLSAISSAGEFFATEQMPQKEAEDYITRFFDGDKSWNQDLMFHNFPMEQEDPDVSQNRELAQIVASLQGSSNWDS